MRQDSVPYLDPETHEPMFLEDTRFNESLTYLEKLYSIPGIINNQVSAEENIKGTLAALKNQEVAMAYGVNWHWSFASAKEEEGLNWGMVNIPGWPGHEQVLPESYSQGFAISAVSEHQDQAFKVIEVILSEEVQSQRVRTGDSTAQKYHRVKRLKIPHHFGVCI